MNTAIAAEITALDQKIVELKDQLVKVEGTPTEVYTRIVGYYRSVRNWNRGKREEYNHRIPFIVTEKDSAAKKKEPIRKAVITPIQESIPSETAGTENGGYLYFYRKTCPNCPPVKNYLDELEMEGENVNVDENAGMEKAIRFNVLSAPTVIFLNSEGNEIGRADSVSSLENHFNVQAAAGSY